MNTTWKIVLQAMILLTLLAAVLPAQQTTTPVVTNVMATLSVNNGITRDQVMKVMQQEVRDTVQLHLDGHIQQWYARGDGKGVVFILNCKSTSEAKALLDELPLIKNNLATFEYVELGPLSPLRILLAAPGK